MTRLPARRTEPSTAGSAWLAAALVALIGGCSKGGSSGFLTTPASDARVVAVSPKAGSSDVPRLPLVSIEFSRPMQASSFSSDTLRVEVNGEPVSGRVAASGRFASFRPSLDLSAGTRHVVVLSAEVRDSDGHPLNESLRFEFRTIEKPPFSLEGTFPVNGQRGFNVTGVIQATFSDEIDPDAFDPSWFALSGPAGPKASDVKIAGRSLFLVPLGFLEEEATYTASLSPEIRSLEGEELGERVDFEFKTGRFLEVTRLVPSPDAEDVARSARLRAEFSRRLDSASIDDESFRLENAAGEPVDGTTSVEGNLAFWDPVERLDPESEYTAHLSETIRAEEGPTLREPIDWSFRTEPARVPPMVFALVSVREGANMIVGYPLDARGGLIGDGVVTPSGGWGSSLLWIEALNLSTDEEYLFASNTYSGDVASLHIELDGSLSFAPGSPYTTVGRSPAANIPSANGRWLFVAEDSREISTFDIHSDGTLSLRPDTFAIAGQPFNLKVTPDNRWLLVAYAGAPTFVHVLAIDPDGGLKEHTTLPHGNSGVTAISVSPNNEFVFATDWGDTGIFVHRPGSWQPVSGSPFRNQAIDPVDSVISPDGQFLFIANRNSHNVSGFRIDAEGALINVPDAPFSVDNSPNAISVSKSGIVYVGNARTFSISAFQIASNGSLVPLHASKKLPVTGSWLIGLAVTSP